MIQPVKAPKLNTEDRLALMKRIEAGETQASLAREFSVTKQYISVLWKAYQSHGIRGIEEKGHGPRPIHDFTPEEEAKICALIQAHPHPSELGFTVADNKKDAWTPSLILKLAKREFKFTPKLSQIHQLLRERDIVLPKPGKLLTPEFDDDYYEYIKSPIAQQIFERERIASEKWERELELRRKNSNPVSSPDSEGEKRPLSPLQAVRPNRPGYGQRTGKHSKGNSRTTKKKRRK